MIVDAQRIETQKIRLRREQSDAVDVCHLRRVQHLRDYRGTSEGRRLSDRQVVVRQYHGDDVASPAAGGLREEVDRTLEDRQVGNRRPAPNRGLRVEDATNLWELDHAVEWKGRPVVELAAQRVVAAY